jgi:hypothetical protein
MRPSLQNKRDQSTAARSGWVVLSHPSSLQGRSDTPLPITPLLPVLSDLRSAYRRRSSMEAVGLQVQASSLFLRIPMALPRVPDRFTCPFHPLPAVAFPKDLVGRRVAHFAVGLSPNRTLPAIPVRHLLTRLHHSLYATVCGFG